MMICKLQLLVIWEQGSWLGTRLGGRNWRERGAIENQKSNEDTKCYDWIWSPNRVGSIEHKNWLVKGYSSLTIYLSLFMGL